MNKTFLEYVTADILNKYGNNLTDIVVVFPNKRAALFMNEYLARLSEKPIWSPSYITISDLFKEHSTLSIGDPIKLICDLYSSFKECVATNETLDQFYGWGLLLLSDFDDIDKNATDAKKVFANITDIHEFDDISYLTDEQKDVLKKFFSNFSDEHNSELKQRFLSLWSHLYDIYKNFNKRLKNQGLAYEGALYREVVNNEDIAFKHKMYIFVGFNMLHEVESKLFTILHKKGKAKFYWDFDINYTNQENINEAGHYIAENIYRFPNELDNSNDEIYNNLRNQKNITFINSSTENIQARYITKWIKENNRISSGSKAAIILCNESLLQTVIHCIPPEVKDVNITIGYPLSQTPISSFINQLITLQTIGAVKGKDKYRLRYVNTVLTHPYAHYLSQKCTDLNIELNEKKRYYPSRDELIKDDELNVLFRKIQPEEQFNNDLITWLIDIIIIVGKNSKDDDNQLFKESVFRTFTLLNRLKDLVDSGDLQVDITTLQRLLKQLIQSTSIPFHGEPIVGLQIMGVLETRNLDFDHILMLSCNEGNMPKGINDSSFIPYSIRKAYGLTTIDNKIAIYAYYFYRLIQRANDITITYNDSTEEGRTGEMSRFMLQMIVESGQHILRKSLITGQSSIKRVYKSISKNKTVMDILENITYMSPSAINTYINCQLQYYYKYIADIKESDDNNEDQIDNRIFGNIFHLSTEMLYEQFKKSNQEITNTDIESIIKNTRFIESIVDQAFQIELFKIKDSKGYVPEYNGLQLINRNVIIGFIKQLLRIDQKLTPFSILGLENDVFENIHITTSNGDKEIKIGGRIDRLDKINDDKGALIRVVDYKTGTKDKKSIANIEAIFSDKDIRNNHSDYFLQACLYSMIVSNDKDLNKENLPVSPALLFIQRSSQDGYDPTLSIGKDILRDIKEYEEEFRNYLQNILTEIFEPTKEFAPASDRSKCNNCPYNKLCGL